MATTENEELQQLRLKVVQLESQLKETLTELRTLKLRNEELETKLADQTVTNTSLRESLSRKGEREDEETTIELQYDPGPGPFIDFATPDNETNIALIEEIKDLSTTKSRRTSSFLFNSSSNSPSRKNSSSGLATTQSGSIFDDQRPNVQVKILDCKNGESMSDLFVTCKTFHIRETSTQSSEVFKTKVLKKPSEGWSESHSIHISDIISVRLLFQIYEWKALGSNQKLLETSISLGTLLENQTQDLWLSFPGTIFQLHVELSYYQLIKTKIKGATIGKIVEKMTPANRKDRDRELVYEFLYTYQLYTSPHHFLDLLIERFNGLDVNHPDFNKYKNSFPAIRNSVGFVLFKWIRITRDFHRDNSLCLKLSEFIAKAGKSAYLDIVFSDLQKILDTPHDITELPNTFEKLNIDEIDADTISEQITLIEFNLVKKIDPFEFLNQHWMKENKAKLAGNILNYISWFNKISSWISTEIIKRNSAEERSVVIGKFIQMAKKFRSLNNFNGIMEVLASLHSSAISRLQSSWLLLPKNLSDNFLELSELMQPNENFKKYRETNKNLSPSIPHIALILQDLTFIYDGNPDTIENGLLNLEKTKMVYRKIKEFQHFLSKEYSIKALPNFKETFDAIEVWQEHDIYRLSKVKEKKSDNMQQTARFDSKTFEKISRNIMSGSQNVSTEVIDLTIRDWQLLLTLATVRTFVKENYIIKEGGVNTYFYKIKEGVVRVEKNINNENQVLRKLEANATFGEMSLVGLVTASIISDTDVELWAIDIELTNALFESEAGLSLRFFCKLAQGLASILVSLSSNKKPAPATPAIEAPPTSPVTPKKEVVAEDTENLDVILRRHFDLAKDQVVVKHYKCALKKKLNLWGQLFITKNFICFLAKTLGLYSTLKINTENVSIVYIQGEKELVIQQHNHAKHGFLFKDKHELWEAHHFITTIWTNRTQMKKRGSFTVSKEIMSSALIPNSPTPTPNSNSAIYEQETQSIYETMKPEDWDLLLQGAKSVTIMKGQDIIKQGEIYQRIYQINRGQCRIEILKNNQRVKLGVMNVRETFGEISFLIGGNGASAFVVAEEEVELTVIEGYYINALFNVNPQFAGRFYKYLAFLLAHRIKQRQKQ